jgi:hypothetical protein
MSDPLQEQAGALSEQEMRLVASLREDAQNRFRSSPYEVLAALAIIDRLSAERASKGAVEPVAADKWRAEYERRKERYRHATSIADNARRSSEETGSQWVARAEALATLVRETERALDEWVL